MRFPAQLSWAVLTVSACIAGLVYLGQRRTALKEVELAQLPQNGQAPFAANDARQEGPPAALAEAIAAGQGLPLAEAMIPASAWALLSMEGALTKVSPFFESEQPICRDVAAPQYLAVGILPSSLAEAMEHVVALSPYVSREFFTCAALEMKKRGGPVEESAQGQFAGGPAGILYRSRSGAFAFARAKEDLAPLVVSLEKLDTLAKLHARGQREAPRLSVLLRPPSGWLMDAGPLAAESPLRYLNYVRVNLRPGVLGNDTLQGEVGCDLMGCDALYKFFGRAIADLQTPADGPAPENETTLATLGLPGVLTEALREASQGLQLRPPRKEEQKSLGVIEFYLDPAKNKLPAFLQQALDAGSAPTPAHAPTPNGP